MNRRATPSLSPRPTVERGAGRGSVLTLFFLVVATLLVDPASAAAQPAGAGACADSTVGFEESRSSCLEALRSAPTDSAFGRALLVYSLSVFSGDLEQMPSRVHQVRQDLLGLGGEADRPERRAALSYWSAEMLSSHAISMITRAVTREGEEKCALYRAGVDSLQHAQARLEEIDLSRVLEATGGVNPQVLSALKKQRGAGRERIAKLRERLSEQCRR